MSSAGRYEIHSEIAAGGMARVCLGTLRGDQGFSRVVAIKVMHPKLARDPKFVAMFKDEALLASRVRHPNVVPTLDVVSEGADVRIVMEYVRGLPLSALLARAAQVGEAMPIPVAVSILGGILAGLHAAHEARGSDGTPLSIVHRDVSPQNVIVDADGVARLVDFGIAKASSQLHMTMEGEIKGKLAFMAPEQVLGKRIDRRVDVFAAGIVFHCMVMGYSLFGRGEVDEVTGRVLHMKIPRLVDERPEVGAALSAVIAKALERNPAARFPTARDFGIAVESAFERPASARQVGAWVERLGGATLAMRDREVARIEAGAPPEAPTEGPLEITSTDAPTIELGPERPLVPAQQPAGGEVAERTEPSVVSDVDQKPGRRFPPMKMLAAAAALAAFVAVALFFTTRGAPPKRPSATEPRSSESSETPAPAPTEASTATVELAPTGSAEDPPTEPLVEPATDTAAAMPVESAAPSARRRPLPPSGGRNTPGYFPARP